jgi:multidrug efflux pump subunit AcrB
MPQVAVFDPQAAPMRSPSLRTLRAILRDPWFWFLVVVFYVALSLLVYRHLPSWMVPVWWSNLYSAPSSVRPIM